MLTNEQYVQKDGIVCPFCEASNVRITSGLDAAESIIYQDVQCCNCNEKWQDVYVLAGYEKISE